MEQRKYILFDFDGTIGDTINLALEIYNRIAPEYKCKVIGHEDIKHLRSKELRASFRDYGITKARLIRLVLRIRKEMKMHIPVVTPAGNIKHCLYELSHAGYKLGIVSSNSKENISLFLANNGLSGIIDFIYTSSRLYGKDRVIMRVLDLCRIPKDDVVYIGDETRDIEASRKAGIPVIAVSWGLTDREALEEFNPDVVVDDAEDLAEAVREIFAGR